MSSKIGGLRLDLQWALGAARRRIYGTRFHSVFNLNFFEKISKTAKFGCRTEIFERAVVEITEVEELLLDNFPAVSDAIPDYVSETRDILVLKRVDVLADGWGTLKRVAGALVFEKYRVGFICCLICQCI